MGVRKTRRENQDRAEVDQVRWWLKESPPEIILDEVVLKDAVFVDRRPMVVVGFTPTRRPICAYVDDQDRINHRVLTSGHVERMRDRLQMKSIWPISGRDSKAGDIEEEERAAAEARRIQRREQKKSARKSRRSLKLKRKTPVPA